MHNRLFENQSAWSSLGGDQRTEFFVAAASDLGLNTDQFKKDLNNDNIKKKISFDEALGRKINLKMCIRDRPNPPGCTLRLSFVSKYVPKIRHKSDGIYNC